MSMSRTKLMTNDFSLSKFNFPILVDVSRAKKISAGVFAHAEI